MIEALAIQNLRGIAEASVEGLGALTVLVGRNGTGKSTVLEGLAIGASRRPGALLGMAVQGRGGWNGARYVVGPAADTARVKVARVGGGYRWIDLSVQAVDATSTDAALDGPTLAVSLVVDDTSGAHGPLGAVRFSLDNRYVDGVRHGQLDGVHTLLVDQGAARTHPLWKDLDRAVQAGHDQRVFDLVREIVGPHFRDLYPLREHGEGHTNVHLRFTDGRPSVPVAVAGDGLRALIRLALNVGGPRGSLVLVEEPELRLHPGALRHVAAVLQGAVAAGQQVVVSTHSLELIDALVDLDVESLVVMRTKLRDGRLTVHRIPGEEVLALRSTLDEDLR